MLVQVTVVRLELDSNASRKATPWAGKVDDMVQENRVYARRTSQKAQGANAETPFFGTPARLHGLSRKKLVWAQVPASKLRAFSTCWYLHCVLHTKPSFVRTLARCSLQSSRL